MTTPPWLEPDRVSEELEAIVAPVWEHLFGEPFRNVPKGAAYRQLATRLLGEHWYLTHTPARRTVGRASGTYINPTAPRVRVTGTTKLASTVVCGAFVARDHWRALHPYANVELERQQRALRLCEVLEGAASALLLGGHAQPTTERVVGEMRRRGAEEGT